MAWSRQGLTLPLIIVPLNPELKVVGVLLVSAVDQRTLTHHHAAGSSILMVCLDILESVPRLASPGTYEARLSELHEVPLRVLRDEVELDRGLLFISKRSLFI